jgi:hypothetical protein
MREMFFTYSKLRPEQVVTLPHLPSGGGIALPRLMWTSVAVGHSESNHRSAGERQIVLHAACGFYVVVRQPRVEVPHLYPETDRYFE